MNMNMINSILEGGFGMDDDIDNNTCCQYPFSSTMLLDDDNYNINPQDIETLIGLHNYGRFPVLDDHHHEDNNIDMISSTTTEDVLVYFKDPVSDVSTTDDIVSMSAHEISSDVSSLLDVTSSSLELGLEIISNEVSVFHLLVAYAEAMEMGQEELAEVIGKRIGEKVGPVGDTVERLMYYMFQSADYLNQESVKNFHQAFEALYQILPPGKFAHFAANLAILEALPKEDDDDVEAIVIFDFDIGEGIQWASLIQAITGLGGLVEVRIISVKFVGDQEEAEENDDQLQSYNNNNNNNNNGSHQYHSRKLWKFEDTKKRLSDYARSYGLKLKVEEMEWDADDHDLDHLVDVEKIKQNLKYEGRSLREFYVFNCMVGLPHMGRVRSRKDVFNFLQISQTFLQRYGSGSHGYMRNYYYKNRGIVTLGEGDAWEKVRNAPNYASFLDENMAHYQALLQSIKLNFPSHLGDARTAIECLFVAPFVSCKAWAQQWVERKKYGGDDHLLLDQVEYSSRLGLQGLSFSGQSLLEAKEVVREGESLYRVRIEGESHNEIIMDWTGIPMVKVSCWRS